MELGLRFGVRVRVSGLWWMDRQKDRQTDRERERKIASQRQTDRDTERERHRERETVRGTVRETVRKRRERESGPGKVNNGKGQQDQMAACCEISISPPL